MAAQAATSASLRFTERVKTRRGGHLGFGTFVSSSLGLCEFLEASRSYVEEPCKAAIKEPVMPLKGLERWHLHRVHQA